MLLGGSHEIYVELSITLFITIFDPRLWLSASPAPLRKLIDKSQPPLLNQLSLTWL